MPVNKINITLTPTQLTAIQAALDAMKSNVPFAVNLTKKERTELSNISDERLAFVTKVINNYAPANPSLVSGFAGRMPDAQNDFQLYNQFEPFIEQLRSIIEMYQDTQQAAGSEAYTFSREFYSSVQRAAENNVPGSDAIADDLGVLFAAQGPPGTPPTP